MRRTEWERWSWEEEADGKKNEIALKNRDENGPSNRS